MRRLMDLAVLAIFVLTVVVTVQSFRRKEELPPPPTAAVAPPEDAPAEGPAAIEPPTPQYDVVMVGPAPSEIHDTGSADADADNDDQGLVDAIRSPSSRRAPSADAPRPSGWGRDPARSSAPSPSEASTRRGASEVDQKRAEARMRLESKYRSIGSRARRLVHDAQEHARGCGNDTQGYCGVSLQNIARQALDIGRDLEAAQELARTSWLNPGEVRDLREKNGLDDAVWDRLIELVNRYGR